MILIIYIVVQLAMGVSVDCPEVISIASLNMHVRQSLQMTNIQNNCCGKILELQNDCCRVNTGIAYNAGRVAQIIWNSLTLDGTARFTIGYQEESPVHCHQVCLLWTWDRTS